MVKVVAKFTKREHAEVCLSNLTEAGFEYETKRDQNLVIISLNIPLSSVAAAKETILDHQPDSITINNK